VSNYDNIIAIVPGGSNTDLVITGARMVAPGELSAGGRFTVGPGGKSRNVAQMMATYLGPQRVAFLGRTLAAGSFDELDKVLSGEVEGDLLPQVYSLLAQVPVAALERAGVVTDFLTRVAYAAAAGGVAEILVGPSGENTIYLAPGVNAQFCPADIDAAEVLFDAVGRNGGRAVMPLALEIPLATAVHAARKARAAGMTVVLDPGGIDAAGDYGEILSLAEVVKPNEQEARLLTGVAVSDESSAGEAAEVLAKEFGIARTVITAGSRGAWHCAAGAVAFYPAYRAGRAADTTGCGDQFLAVLCSHLATEPGRLDEAFRAAIVASGLQATRVGIQPVTRDEVAEHLPRYDSQSDRNRS